MDVNGIYNEIKTYAPSSIMEPVTEKEAKITTKGNEKKNDYLELAVGAKENELKRLGLTKEEDGAVTLKKRDTDKTPCETCANRKYQDGSDEMVSFKSATHISPEAAASRVRAHEQEHVVNAYEKAEKNDGEVQSASVAIHTATCPECGRVYVSGGTTTTTIRYNEDNYAANAKKQDKSIIPGVNIDQMA